MNIDIKKLKAAILEMNAARKAGPPQITQFGFDWWRDPELVLRYDAERKVLAAWEAQYNPGRATALYSLRSHLRGRLHVKARWELVAGRRQKVEKTLADQEQLIGQISQEFTRADSAETPRTSA